MGGKTGRGHSRKTFTIGGEVSGKGHHQVDQSAYVLFGCRNTSIERVAAGKKARGKKRGEMVSGYMDEAPTSFIAGTVERRE